MHLLRTSRSIAALVLAWIVLATGVAVAAPLVVGQTLEMVCSGAGMKLVAAGGDADVDGQPQPSALDCPLCASLAAPPPAAVPAVFLPPLAHALKAIPSARIAALTAGPLPARGPPVRS